MNKNLLKKIENFNEKYVFLKRPFFCIFAVYCISFIAILRANYYYIDDLGRANLGYKDWSGTFFRHTSTILSFFIHADYYLTDVSPLPQIIALCFLALSGVLMVYIITEKKEFNFIKQGYIVAVIPIGLSPYFLQCLSYKYDAPYMALAILGGIMPLMFIEYGYKIYIASAFIGNMIMFTTYQADSGVFPILVVMLGFKWWNCGKKIKDIGKFILYSFCGYVSAFLVFRIFIMKPIDSYVSSSVASFGQIITNYKKYFDYIYTDLKKWWIMLIIFIIFGFIYTSVKASKRKLWQSLFMTILVTCVCMLLTFGLYPALSLPSFDPRGMNGFGVMVSVFAVMALNNKKSYFLRMVCFILSWSFCVFGFTYGNALAEQKRYTDFRIQEVVNDLGALDIVNSGRKITLQLSGSIGKSSVINHMPQSYQILNRLLPESFAGGMYWNGCYFYDYFGLKNIERNDEIDLTTYNLPVLSNTMYHTIKGDENYILILLK